MDTVTLLTTAPMGGYKSYSRGPSFVIDQFLPNHDGHLYTTIPLRVDEIAALAKKRHKIPESETKRRIHVLSQELVLSWTKENSLSGPWDLSLERLEGSHLQFDEFHHYAPRTQEVERRKKWREWLSEIRHEGATIEFLTQDVTALDERLVKMITLRYDLVNLETQRDPFFKIRMLDWYELRSKSVGYWKPTIVQLEKIKVDGKWKAIDEQRKISPIPAFYNAYDSFSKPHKRVEADTEKSDSVDVENELNKKTEIVKPKNKNLKQWEKRSWLSLVLWFLAKNTWQVFSRFSLIMFLIWVCFMGGGKILASKAMDIPKKVTGNLVNKTSVADFEVEKNVSQNPDQEKNIELENIDNDRIVCRTNFNDEQKEYRISDIEKLVIDREVLISACKNYEEEISILKENHTRLSMIASEYIIFESGNKYRINDIVKEKGSYGKQIKFIDFNNSCVVYDDGSSLGLSSARAEYKQRPAVVNSLQSKTHRTN